MAKIEEEKFVEKGICIPEVKFDGSIYLDPIKELSGVKGGKIFNAMQNDHSIFAFYSICTRLMSLPDWSVAPALADDEQALSNSEFINSCLVDLDKNFSEFVGNVTTTLIYGFSFFEIIYKKRTDGKIGWEDFSPRSQLSILQGGWLFDDKNKVIGARQYFNGRTIDLMLDRCILFNINSENRNPQGKSAFYGAYQPWIKKVKIEAIESVGVERDAVGVPVMYVNEEVFTPEKKVQLDGYQKIVTSLKQDKLSGVLLPSTKDENGNPKFKLELLSSSGTKKYNVDEIIDRLDLNILTSLLADFMAVGHGNSGSFSLHSDKTDMFILSLESILKQITDYFNEVEIPRLLGYNGIFDNIPKLGYTPIKKEDVTAFIDNYAKVAGLLGLNIDDTATNVVREKLGLPIVEVL